MQLCVYSITSVMSHGISLMNEHAFGNGGIEINRLCFHNCYLLIGWAFRYNFALLSFLSERENSPMKVIEFYDVGQ